MCTWVTKLQVAVMHQEMQQHASKGSEEDVNNVGSKHMRKISVANDV